MEAFTVRDLRERTGELIRGAEQGHLSVITKHGNPVFVAVPFDAVLLENGVRASLAISCSTMARCRWRKPPNWRGWESRRLWSESVPPASQSCERPPKNWMPNSR